VDELVAVHPPDDLGLILGDDQSGQERRRREVAFGPEGPTGPLGGLLVSGLEPADLHEITLPRSPQRIALSLGGAHEHHAAVADVGHLGEVQVGGRDPREERFAGSVTKFAVYVS
jgi:hypothetical protein